MSNEEETPTNPLQSARAPRGMSLEETHAMRHDNAILVLQQSVRQISRQLEQLTTQFLALQRGQRPQEPYDDGDDQSFSSDSSIGSNPRRGGRRPPMDEFRDIKVEPPEFNDNLNPDEYLQWVQPWTESLKPRAIMMKEVSRLLALNSQGMPPCGLKTSKANG